MNSAAGAASSVPRISEPARTAVEPIRRTATESATPGTPQSTAVATPRTTVSTCRESTVPRPRGPRPSSLLPAELQLELGAGPQPCGEVVAGDPLDQARGDRAKRGA